MGTAIFQITDGTSTIDLLDPTKKYAQKAWRQAIAQYKGGGTWTESSLSDGRRIVNRQFGNMRQEISLTINTAEQDSFARAFQDLMRLLEKAADYWITDWQNEPVYIISKADCETNTRYAYVYTGTVPDLENIYPDASTRTLFITDQVMESLALILEHTFWQDRIPGSDSCAEISGKQAGIDDQVTWSGFVLQSSDDGKYIGNSTTFTILSTSVSIGYEPAGPSFSFVRFDNVNVPAGATILSAYIRFEAIGNTGPGGHVNIFGELASDPATFSTYSDVVGRIKTSNFIEWPPAGSNGAGLAAWVDGTDYDTPDITNIIEEIIAQSGWAANQAMVFFIDDIGGAASGINRGASWDAVAGYDPPELFITYDATGTELGRTETCTDEVYIANQHKSAQLTDAYHYDASLGAWSGNLLAAALPYSLLPNPVANDDSLFLIIDTGLVDSGPFCSAVFDILAAATFTGTGRFEWSVWTGVWTAISVEDKTAPGADLTFGNTGVNSVHWAQPSTWIVGNLNTIFGGAAPNVDGYIVRVKAIIAAPPGDSITTPTQQNRQPYTISWAGVDIQSDQVLGDIQALARVRFHNQSDNYGGGIDLFASRVIMALRSYDRGANFRPFINLANEQNPPGIQTFAGGVETSFTTDPTTAAGRRVTYAPVASLAINSRASIVFGGDIGAEYYGKYRVFLRARQSGGDLTTNYISVRLRTYLSGGIVYTSSTLRFDYTTDWQLLDFGEIELPQTGPLDAGETYDYGMSIMIQAGASTNTPELHIYDLVLMPADEYILDIVDPIATSTTANRGWILGKPYTFESERYLMIDGTSLPKQPVRANNHRVDNDGIKAVWLPIGGQPVLQSNKQQRLWFLTTRMNDPGTGVEDFRSEPWIAHSVQLFKVQRYFAMRGDR